MQPSPSLSKNETPYPWRAQTGPQLTAIQRHLIDELFYGGAVGGGKSDYLLGDFAQDVPSPWGAHWRGILFRKTYAELEDLISRSQQIYPPWFPGCKWSVQDSLWSWPNGATLKMRYLESATDWMRYWGHAYTWIGWDELPNWPDMDAYVKMKARLRSAHEVPNKRIRATGNPGGPGHGHVKAYFRIDQHPLGGEIFEQGGMKRLFVRSRLADNRILLRHDPKYAQRLAGLGSPDLVRAWLEGDWNVIAGAFFPEFGDRHIVDPIELPTHWTRFRAMDWGSAKPFSVGWYAVSDGELPQFPRGALIKYREWYGMVAGQPNTGLKMTATEVGKGIVARQEKDEVISYSVLDPSAFAEDGGPSIAEMLSKAGAVFRAADNKRVTQRGAMGGWDQVRGRLKGDAKPMLYFFSTCTHTIRTLPALQHDVTKPEDVDTDAEDHAGDETRYACMSRPWTQSIPPDSGPPRGARTIEEMVRRHEARQEDYRRI